MLDNYPAYQKQLKHFQSGNGNLAYFDQGSGQCILLLHGVPTSSWLYRKIIPSLLKGGYRVIAPDMLGYGSSDKPKGYDIYSPEQTGKRLLALMDHLQIPTWTQVFHDGGGLWTWAMLQQDSSRVTQLVMLNTIVYQEGFKPPMKFKPGLIGKIYAWLYTHPIGQAMVINGTFKNGVNDKSSINKDMLAGYKLPLLKNGHHAMYYFFTQTCQLIPDFTQLHQSLKMPLTVIWGTSDKILVWEKMKSKVLANFNLTEEDIHLIDAKHFIQEEKAALVSNLIINSVKIKR